jgi:glucokinase
MTQPLHAGRRLGLVGDIGGTNARFGLVDLDAAQVEVLGPAEGPCADHPRALDAIRSYLEAQGVVEAPPAAVVAVAGPVERGAIRFTNSPWALSEGDLHSLGVGTARLVNDYAAQALAAPLLGGKDLHVLGPAIPAPDPGGTILVLGPGTGFGVSGLARDGAGEVALSTEGGHVGFAPGDEVEIEILRRLTRRHGRVSVERILSGPGLVELHAVLQAIDGRATDLDDPAAISAGAREGDAACAATLERFCAILGSVAGDFALAYGARGGVFIAGGIAPRILDLIGRSAFRARFEAKGRFTAYLKAIPTAVIVRRNAALLGAARALRAL